MVGDTPAVRVQHATAGQQLGPVVDLGIPADIDAQVDVAVGANGAAAVVWIGRVTAADAVAPQLTLLAPDGTVVTTLEIAPDLDSGLPAVAVDGDGDALLAWGGFDAGLGSPTVRVQRVSADGDLGPLRSFQVDSADSPQVAVTPGGVGWVLWNDSRSVARFAADGSFDGQDDIVPTGPSALPSISAGENGGAVARLVTIGGRLRIDGVRLRTSDDVLGAPFSAPEMTLQNPPPFQSLAPAVAPDGSITLAWSDGITGSGPDDSRLWISTARFPGESTVTAPARRVPDSALAGTLGDLLPVLAQRPGGADALLVSGAIGRSAKALLTATTVGADGASVAPVSTGLSLPGQYLLGDQVVKPFATADGGALLTAPVPAAEVAFASLQTRRYDAAPPQLTATIPATAEAGRAAGFSASATDLLGGTRLWWDFGDGNGARGGSVSHVYTAPGTYTVTVTAEDDVANVATFARQLTVPAPPAPPKPPAPQPEPGDRRAAAQLKLTSAVRSGARVTIAGTIARSATGTVRLTYAQKSGRRTLTASASARIAKGRFAATIRLGRALAKRFKLKPVVTAVYAGDAKTDAARAARTVTVRAARRAARRGAKKRRR